LFILIIEYEEGYDLSFYPYIHPSIDPNINQSISNTNVLICGVAEEDKVLFKVAYDILVR